MARRPRARGTARTTSSASSPHAVDARGADPLARAVARLRATPTRSCSSTRANRSSARQRASQRRSLAECPRRAGARDEPRGAPRPGRGASRRRAARAARSRSDRRRRSRRCSSSSSARTRGAPRIRAHAGERRARRGDQPPSRRAAARDRARRRARSTLSGSRRSCSSSSAASSLLRDRPASDAGRAALGTLVEWSYDLLHEDEKSLLHEVAVHRGGASLPSLVAVGASRGARRGNRDLPARRAGRQVDPVRVVPCRRRAVRPARHGAGLRPGAPCRDRPPRTPRGGRTPSTSRRSPTQRATELRGRDWQAWVGRLELEHDNLWAALAYARDARDSGIAARLASLAWYFTLAERVTEGRRFVELALADGVGRHSARSSGSSSLGILCFLATEELDLDGAIEIGERALALDTRPGRTRRKSGWRRRRSRLRSREAGDVERGAALAEQARATLEGGRRPLGVRSGQPPPCADRGSRAGRLHGRRHGGGRAPPRRGDRVRRIPRPGDAARCVGRRAPERRRRRDGRVRSRTRSRGSTQASRTTPRSPCPGSLRAPSRAETCATPKSSHGARSQPPRQRVRPGPPPMRASSSARILAAAGDTDTAAKLYRNVLAWSKLPRQHGPRESLFIALAEDPAAAASAGLAALGDAPRSDGAAAAPA